MHFPVLTFFLITLPSLISASTLGDITQTSHKIADATDQKQYDKLDTVMARDVVIDATALQPFTGGVLRGREQVKARFRQAGAGAKTVHRITNFLLLEEKGNQAKTSSYVDHLHYVKGALGDKTKTWRIQYRSENTWVKQGGEWKLQYNKLYDLVYGAERPFY